MKEVKDEEEMKESISEDIEMTLRSIVNRIEVFTDIKMFSEFIDKLERQL